MSASFTASELSVPACTLNFSFSIRARSGCATVARLCPGDSNPSRKKDCSRIDPIFPAPKTATFFFPLKLRPMRILQTQFSQRLAIRQPLHYTTPGKRFEGVRVSRFQIELPEPWFYLETLKP